MAATFTRVLKFRNTQAVSFVSPKGIVRNYKPESGTWTYFIEMPLGLEPDFGSIGAETMINSTPVSRTALVLSQRKVAFFATIHTLALLAPWYFSWSALGVAITLYWLLGSISICLGYPMLLFGCILYRIIL